MKTRYYFVHFKESPSSAGKTSFNCYTILDNYFLGSVKFYSSDNLYYFFPYVNSQYSSDALNDIAAFINQLNNQ